MIEATRQSCDCEREPIRVWRPSIMGPGCWETIGYETSCEAEVHYMVKNIGTQDAGEFHVKMKSSTGDTDTAYFDGLLADEEKNRWFDFTSEGGDTITVTLIADSDEEVDECEEDNNTADTSLRCQ